MDELARMNDLLHEFLMPFIPLFVAIAIVGVLPIYLGFVASLEVQDRQRLTAEAILTAAGIGPGFLFLGDTVLHLVGVRVGDFQMAGGLLLLLLAIYSLLHPELPHRQPGTHLGVVPLGTPLIVGPADHVTDARPQPRLHAYAHRVPFQLGDRVGGTALGPVIVRVIGEAGAHAMAKVFGLLLAAIDVMLIRRGLELTLQEGGFVCQAEPLVDSSLQAAGIPPAGAVRRRTSRSSTPGVGASC